MVVSVDEPLFTLGFKSIQMFHFCVWILVCSKYSQDRACGYSGVTCVLTDKPFFTKGFKSIEMFHFCVWRHVCSKTKTSNTCQNSVPNQQFLGNLSYFPKLGFLFSTSLAPWVLKMCSKNTSKQGKYTNYCISYPPFFLFFFFFLTDQLAILATKHLFF